jgi:signal transduction histidine kinase
MSKSVEEAVKEIRVLSYLMMPPGLQKDGLEATVRAFLKGFGTRTGLHASFSAEGDVDNVSSAVKHAALRVVQEALSNVYRHAEAHDVAVELARSNGALVVRVADDGKGIPSVSSDASGLSNVGVGIAGMRARVSQLGGTLQIASDGAGAVVTATLPAFAGTGGEPAPDPPGDRSAFNSSRFGGNA